MSSTVLPLTPSEWRPLAAFISLALTAMMIVPIALVWPTGASAGTSSVWLSPAEIAALPMSGSAWDRVLSRANEDPGSDANISHRTDHNIVTLAAALVAARRNDDAYRAKVARNIEAVMATKPDPSDLLAACRRLGTYAVAADLISLSTYHPALDSDFRLWLGDMEHISYTGGSGGGTIVQIHERRPNNFGTDAGASRLAVALYLGDSASVARVATIFKGWLGDRSSYSGFDFSADPTWQSNQAAPVGINPRGATIDGHPVDGVLPEDQRRAGSFSWPPPKENYVWGALQGATFQAALLARHGYDVWRWSDSAMLRAVTWLHDVVDFPAVTDDVWVQWVINQAYGTSFPAGVAQDGKGMAFSDWTHAGKAAVSPTPTPPPSTTAPPTTTPPPITTPPPATTAPATGAIQYLSTATGESTQMASVVSQTVKPSRGAVYVASVSTRTYRAVTSLKGLGLRWVKVVEQCGGRGTSGASLWVGTGEPTAAGRVSATLRASVRYASLSVTQYGGVDAANPVVSAASANTLGSAGKCRGGVDSASYTVGTAGASGDLVLAAVTTRGWAHTPGAGFVEHLDMISRPGGQAAQDIETTVSKTTVTGGLTRAWDWAAAAVRLRPAPS